MVAASPNADSSQARRTAILDAATEVFLRYGYKKTSMDDLARAAGLSRQGLYLHFATKDLLFKASILRLVEVTRQAGLAALAREDQPIEERLLAFYEVADGSMLGKTGVVQLSELMETALQLIGPIAAEFEAERVIEIAKQLRQRGVATAWKGLGISAKVLATHLGVTSYGLKHTVADLAAYRDGMRIAIQLVCRGRART